MGREYMHRAVIGRQTDENILLQSAVKKGYLVLTVPVCIWISGRYSFDLILVHRFCQSFLNEIFASVSRNDDSFHDALHADHSCDRSCIYIVEAWHMVSFNEIRNLFLAFPVARMLCDLIQDISCSSRFPVLHEKIIRTVVADQRICQCQDLSFIRRIRKAFLVSCHARIEYELSHSFYCSQEITLEAGAVF